MNKEDMIFVFGSNEAGIHGAGAALFALRNRGARLGLPFGLEGRSFAVPTKGKRRIPNGPGGGRRYEVGDPLSLAEIKRYVDSFLWHAEKNPDETFQVTAIGCGYAGFRNEQMAPLFADSPANCRMPPEWREELSALPPERFWEY